MTMNHATTARARRRALSAERREAGESPISVMIGLAVFGILALAAGPALASFAAQSASNGNDRRADKALAVLTDTARRAPWGTLKVGGPVSEDVKLAGGTSKVSTWVQVDPTSPARLIITKAVPQYASNAVCDPTDPAALPDDCLVRTATLTAIATDVRPAMSSPGVTLTRAGVGDPAAVSVTEGQELFTIAVTRPVRIAVVARSDVPVTLNLVGTGITRALVNLSTSEASGGWVFGNAVVCPAWSKSAVSAQVAQPLPAGAQMSDLLVLTAPAPGICK